MFLYTLALALGKGVRELLETMDSREISEWWAFHKIHPLPDPWTQTARICRTVMASSGRFKHLPEEWRLIPGKQQSRDEMLQELSKLKPGS